MSDPANNIDISILCILAFCFVTILAGAVWLLLSTLRKACISDDDEWQAEQDHAAQMHQGLTPEGCRYSTILREHLPIQPLVRFFLLSSF